MKRRDFVGWLGLGALMAAIGARLGFPAAPRAAVRRVDVIASFRTKTQASLARAGYGFDLWRQENRRVLTGAVWKLVPEKSARVSYFEVRLPKQSADDSRSRADCMIHQMKYQIVKAIERLEAAPV